MQLWWEHEEPSLNLQQPFIKKVMAVCTHNPREMEGRKRRVAVVGLLADSFTPDSVKYHLSVIRWRMNEQDK